MGLHPQLGGMNKADKRRMYEAKCLGCIACYLRFGMAAEGGDGHHAEDHNGTVIGHHAIIVLCPWHHTAKPPQGYTSTTALVFYGPSRHFHTVAFTETFGNDERLLELTNDRLAEVAANTIC